jgi:hypothetical protein
MLRASEAPFAPDIVHCLKSWTTVDAERGSPCSRTNYHQEEDIGGVDEQSRSRSPKT